MSGASQLSKKSNAPAARHVAPDAQSLRSDVDTVSQAQTVDNLSTLNEEDEWTAIMNFNTILHYEEQKQSLMREKERKRLIKDELDRQVTEKNLRKRKEKHEDQLYDELQKKHLQLLDEKEKERDIATRAKAEREKMSRDEQLKMEKRRKKALERAEAAQEHAVVARLHNEMQQERDLLMEKRRQEREYLQVMLQENEKHKSKVEQQRERERVEDVAAQDAYSKMLEQQEKDRLDEMDRREKRAQEFMGKMADNVLAQMDQKKKTEEEMIRQYEMDKEMQERMNDQLAFKKMKDDQARMREELARQVNDKKTR